ncbi:MAG: hypothetical protein LBD13_07890 [Spirochaetaceae bacterium]|nr:hypothetical protein [Spirochaetaceae bacterium]
MFCLPCRAAGTAFAFCACLAVYGQEPAFLIPHTVFVGDSARLVVSLGAGFSSARPFVITAGLPESEELVIHRVELENRGGNPRLFIDFTAFAPGGLPLPPLKLPLSLSDGITIPIASILDGGSLVLAPPAPPLTVPGTSLLIYGAASLLGIAPLVLAGLRLRAFKVWGASLKRRRLIRRMKKTLKSLRRGASGGEKAAEDALTSVTRGFRAFLSAFTGMRCQAMSAGEFAAMPPLAGETGGEAASPLSGAFLRGLFRRCDDLRFQGRGVDKEEVLGILTEIEGFIDALRAVEGGLNSPPPAPAKGDCA